MSKDYCLELYEQCSDIQLGLSLNKFRKIVKKVRLDATKNFVEIINSLDTNVVSNVKGKGLDEDRKSEELISKEELLKELKVK